MRPEEVIDRQLDAYNRRDIAGFAATYADTVRILDADNARPPLVGIQELREVYGGKVFTRAGLKAEIRTRMVVGNKVIDHELTTWAGLPAPMESVVVYEVVDGLIQNVWFFEPHKAASFPTEA
jgi:hypothetical protein